MVPTEIAVSPAGERIEGFDHADILLTTAAVRGIPIQPHMATLAFPR